jgi:hypothetical protein
MPQNIRNWSIRGISSAYRWIQVASTGKQSFHRQTSNASMHRKENLMNFIAMVALQTGETLK